MARVRVRITGGERLRKLSKLDAKRVGRLALARVIPTINRLWAEAAKSAAPVRTKHLRNTISASGSTKMFRINLVFYGVILNGKVSRNRYHLWAVNALREVLDRPSVKALIADSVNRQIKLSVGVGA